MFNADFGRWFSEPAGLHLGVIGFWEASQESPPDFMIFMGKTMENPMEKPYSFP